MKIFSILFLTSIMLLTGCAGVMVESARITHAATVRDNNMQAARAGNAEAQYLVGKSFCCTPRNNVDAFYNNSKATEFLCLAARQNHAQAAFELGKIYSGDRIDGIRLLRRAVTAIQGDDFTNNQVAYYWFKQAQLNGLDEAADELKQLGDQDISRFTDPASTPCTLSEVTGNTNNENKL